MSSSARPALRCSFPINRGRSSRTRSMARRSRPNTVWAFAAHRARRPARLAGMAARPAAKASARSWPAGFPARAFCGAMKTDSESGHPLRTRLRGMLGLEDPGEPAPWQAGGQWRQSDSDAPDVVATRANTDAVGESTEQQFSLVEQLTDLNNSLRRLLGLGGAGAGAAAGRRSCKRALAAAATARRDSGAGAAAGAAVGPWAAAGGGGGRLAGASISGAGGTAGGGGATGGWTAPAAPAAPAITGGETAGGGGGRGEAAYARASAAGGGRGGGGRGDLYAQRAPMIMADLKRELGAHARTGGRPGRQSRL